MQEIIPRRGKKGLLQTNVCKVETIHASLAVQNKNFPGGSYSERHFLKLNTKPASAEEKITQCFTGSRVIL